MDEEKPRGRQTQFSRAGRTKRILERLRQGWAYDEVAGDERLSERRVRQIVTEFLKEREAVSDAAHAHMPIDRLGRAMRVAGDALNQGDIRAISPFLKVIDRLDRYQTLLAETGARPRTADQMAADEVVIRSFVARMKRQTIEELRRQAPPESDAAAAGSPPERDGDSAALPSLVAEAEDAPSTPPPLAPLAFAPPAPAPPPSNGLITGFFPFCRKRLISPDSGK
jgi:hypothetical protein